MTVSISRQAVGLLLAGACAGVIILGGCRSGGTSEPPPPAAAKQTSYERPAPRPLARPTRGVWVARYHYRTADDVRTIIRNCAAIGCNTVFWQVRGEGTVAYPSQIEPWSREYGFADPGFDPLALAINEAHRNGLRIEAWFNVMPGWKGTTPPPVASQLYRAHPEWFLYDADGRRQPLSDAYVIVNPCLPEVRRHIVAVVAELVSRYDLDGVHLDYVRYAWDGVKQGKSRYPRDPRTLALYRSETGRAPDDDRAAWDHWRANQVTRLVEEIRQTVSRYRPGASLTAAVWRNPALGYKDYLQNSVAWIRARLVDAIMPMAYTDRAGQFEQDIQSYRRAARNCRVVPAVGLYLHKSAEAVRAQLQLCQGWGGEFCLFSYESLFPTVNDAELSPKELAEANRLRQMRRAAVGGQPAR